MPETHTRTVTQYRAWSYAEMHSWVVRRDHSTGEEKEALVNRRLLIILGVALSLVCVCGGVLVPVAARTGGGTKATQTANVQFLEPLQAICSGQGGAVAGAGAYAAGAGIHPVMVFRTLNGTNHNRDTRVGTGDWSPKALSEAQLVACTEDPWVTVESCPYTSKTSGNTSTLTRSQNQVKLRLFAAQTGK